MEISNTPPGQSFCREDKNNKCRKRDTCVGLDCRIKAKPLDGAVNTQKLLVLLLVFLRLNQSATK